MNSYLACPEEGKITHCLHEWQSGSHKAETALYELVFPNLCRLARYILKAEHSRHDLEPRDLVNQVYLRLTAAKKVDWQNRRHFFAVAGRAMRRHVIDCARRRHKVESVALESVAHLLTHDSADLDMLIHVRNLLDQLERINPNWRMIVELKYYLGFTDTEAAQRMGIKLRTMQRMLTDVKQCLYECGGGGRQLGRTVTPEATRSGAERGRSTDLASVSAKRSRPSEISQPKSEPFALT
jgi:RNA polymerase sigma factor (TIGR02999 family)